MIGAGSRTPWSRPSAGPVVGFTDNELKPLGLVRHVAWRADLQMARFAAWTSRPVYACFQEIVASFANDDIRDQLLGWEPWTGDYSQAIAALDKAGIVRMPTERQDHPAMSIFGYPIDASEHAILGAVAASGLVGWAYDDAGFVVTGPRGGRGNVTFEKAGPVVVVHVQRFGMREDGTPNGYAGNRRIPTTSLARGLEFAIEYIDGGGGETGKGKRP